MPSTLQRRIAILKNAAVAGKVHAFEEFESNVPYMYLDVAGQVTVGIGHAILSEEAACQLPFKSADGTPASREVIVAAFKKIHSGRQAQREKAKPASSFAGLTDLILAETDIYRLAQQDIASHEHLLRGKFPDYDRYPAAVQEALLDMIFSMGLNKLMTGCPRFVAAVRAQDWATAAAHSGRRQVQGSRNLAIAGKLRSAAGNGATAAR